MGAWSNSVGSPEVVSDHEEACRWCGRGLTTLLDLVLTSPAWSCLRLPGRRLRIATCDVCACYGTVFTEVDGESRATWHEANRMPDFLPDAAVDQDILPRGCLVPGAETRNWLESASGIWPGVRLSQVGGHPTWEQDAESSRCPECGRPMSFVAQLSNEDYQEYGEGLYDMFACPECGVAATTSQQT